MASSQVTGSGTTTPLVSTSNLNLPPQAAAALEVYKQRDVSKGMLSCTHTLDAALDEGRSEMRSHECSLIVP